MREDAVEPCFLQLKMLCCSLKSTYPHTGSTGSWASMLLRTGLDTHLRESKRFEDRCHSGDKDVVSRSKPVRNTEVACSRTLQVMST